MFLQAKSLTVAATAHYASMTLRLDTLDRAEIEGTINSLGLALAENAEELLNYSKR